MRLSLIRIAVLCSTVTLFATSAHAVQPDELDYGRPGWYAGFGFGAASNFFKDEIEELPGIPGVVEVKTGWSANVRGGYRLTSWFALEAMYEGGYDLNVAALGRDVLQLQWHSFLGNFKLIAPIWRLQPYVMLGLGGQYHIAKIGPTFQGPPINANSVKRWDFVIRPAVGIDMYITENWVLDVEIGIPISLADYSQIPKEYTDNWTITVGAGIQYRF